MREDIALKGGGGGILLHHLQSRSAKGQLKIKHVLLSTTLPETVSPYYTYLVNYAPYTSQMREEMCIRIRFKVSNMLF